MKRFFFHLHEETIVLDAEGKEFLSDVEAIENAITTARAMACAQVMEGHLGLNHRIEVVDAKDVPVATIAFKDAIKLHP